MLVATCTYHEGNDEFHAILQLAKPTDLDSSGNYNTLTAVAAPYNVNVIEEIQRSWGIFGYPKIGGGNLFQYKSIEVYVNDFGAQRTEGSKRRD